MKSLHVTFFGLVQRFRDRRHRAASVRLWTDADLAKALKVVMSVERVDPVIAAHLAKPDTAYRLVSYAPCPVLAIRA